MMTEGRKEKKNKEGKINGDRTKEEKIRKEK